MNRFFYHAWYHLKRSGVLMRVELQRKIFGTACREKFHAALLLFGTNDLYRDHAGKAWVRILEDHRKFHAGHQKG